MIPDYKLYHGAVLAELVSRLKEPVSIDELTEEGRLSSYVLNGCIGLQIKHSTQRLHPWQFTFTKANLIELDQLDKKYWGAFVVFVCRTDGMVTVTLDELRSILSWGEGDQSWVRVDRRRGGLYRINGGAGELSSKKGQGLDLLIAAITNHAAAR